MVMVQEIDERMMVVVEGGGVETGGRGMLSGDGRYVSVEW